MEASDRPVITLRYGDPAPPFRLPSSSDRIVTLDDLKGKPSLVCFVQPWCRPCDREAAGISASCEKWKGKLNILLIVVGNPLIASPSEGAKRFAADLTVQVPVAYDVGGKVARTYCDRPMRSPFSVLLDKDGVVRFIQSGREEGESTLTQDIDTFLNKSPLRTADGYLESVRYDRPAPDSEGSLNGRHFKLSDEWMTKPVILTFSLLNCSSCTRRTMLIERLVGRENAITRLYVYPDQASAATAKTVLGEVSDSIIADGSKVLQAKYQVWNAPSTFWIERGRILFAPGPRSSERELERLITSRISRANSLDKSRQKKQ